MSNIGERGVARKPIDTFRSKIVLHRFSGMAVEVFVEFNFGERRTSYAARRQPFNSVTSNYVA